MDAIDSSKAQMGGCGELVSSKAQMEKARACFSCGKLDHWYDRCPWIGSPCKRYNTGRFVKTSQQPHSCGQKFLSCPKCQSFQWMKDALKESMPEQKPSQLSSQVGGSSSVGSSKWEVQREVDAACGGGGGTCCGCGGCGCGGGGGGTAAGCGAGGGTGVGCGLAFGANFIPNPFAGGGYSDAASSAGHCPMVSVNSK
ncbi:hypothetical protein IFM89_009600 [Coptis chinensis]|uniref:CCHC-type domain-containing protein n=1 Tax=Coptis chinensis TaxID=261450 RepID=A0A835IMA8_9MAGN|nr:hypothetical protein IFM89_009600 [Coptis chinensis]